MGSLATAAHNRMASSPWATRKARCRTRRGHEPRMGAGTRLLIGSRPTETSHSTHTAIRWGFFDAGRPPIARRPFASFRGVMGNLVPSVASLQRARNPSTPDPG
jgi:hypothetical protein